MDTHYALYNKPLKQLTCLLIILLLLVGVPVIAAENRPFPQNIERFGITPNNESVNKQNTAVQNFYIYWRDKYLTPSAKYTGYYT